MKKFIMLSSAVVLVISLAAYCNARSIDRQRISDKDVAEVVDKLTKIIQKLKLEELAGETTLRQRVYKPNDETVYKLVIPGRKKHIIYERRFNDFGKDAIVLLPSEDKISLWKRKNTFVGLRATAPRSDEYFVFNIYLRNPSKNEEGTISVGSERKVVEYDGWRNPESHRSSGFVLGDCSASIFVPCKANHSVSFITPRHASRTKLKSSKSSTFTKSIVTEKGFDAVENLDFYSDLIEHGDQQGRSFFTDLLTSAAAYAGEYGGDLIDLATPLVSSVATKVISKVAGAVTQIGVGGLAGAAKGALKSGAGAVKSAMTDDGGNGTEGGFMKFVSTGFGIVGSAIKGGFSGGMTGAGETVKGMLKGKKDKKDTDMGRSMRNGHHTRHNRRTTITYPGWKTLDSLPESPKDTLTHENDAFLGFGVCRYSQVNQANYEAAKTAEDVIYLIVSALRAQCTEKDVEFYIALFNQGLLTLSTLKTISISFNRELRNMENLNPTQRIELSRALQISAFSLALKEEVYSDKPRLPITTPQVSRSVRVLGQTVLNGIETTRSAFLQHRVKLRRSLALTVKIAIIKLLEDYEAIADCAACALDKQVNHKDLMHLVTLLQFIIHGLAPLEKNFETASEAFIAFKEANHDAIEERVKSYTRADF